jgi:transcription factor MYB, plant
VHKEEAEVEMGLNLPPNNPRHGGTGIGTTAVDSFYWDGTNPSSSSSTGSRGSNIMGFEPQSTSTILEYIAIYFCFLVVT